MHLADLVKEAQVTLDPAGHLQGCAPVSPHSHWSRPAWKISLSTFGFHIPSLSWPQKMRNEGIPIPGCPQNYLHCSIRIHDARQGDHQNRQVATQILPNLKYTRAYTGTHFRNKFHLTIRCLSSNFIARQLANGRRGRERVRCHQTRTHFWGDSNKQLLTGEVISCPNEMWEDIFTQGSWNSTLHTQQSTTSFTDSRAKDKGNCSDPPSTPQEISMDYDWWLTD